MQRRSFLGLLGAVPTMLALPSGLLVPDEEQPRVRAYSFIRRQDVLAPAPLRKPRLMIYSGAPPENPDIPLSGQVLLSEVELDAHPLRKNALRVSGADVSANETGLAGFARLVDAKGRPMLDMALAVPGEEVFGGGPMVMNTRQILAGSHVSFDFEISGMLFPEPFRRQLTTGDFR